MRTRPRTSTAAKGLGGRPATPAYDSLALEHGLIQYVDKAGTAKSFDLGAYWAIPAAFAVRGRDVLRCRALVETILEAAPAGLVWYSDVRRILLNLAMSRPALIGATPANKKIGSALQFGDCLADRIMCLCAHVRRLATNQKKLSECSKSLSPDELEQLRELVAKVEVGELQGAEPEEAKNKKAEPQEAEPESQAVLSAPSPPPKSSVRKGLPRLASEVFPASPPAKKLKKMFSDDAAETPHPSKRRFMGAFSPATGCLLQQAEQASPVPAKKLVVKAMAREAKADIKEAQAAEKAKAKAKSKAAGKPKSQAKAKAKASVATPAVAKAKAKSKARAAAASPALLGQDAGADPYRLTQAADQSYIQVKDPDTNKLKLWVSISANMSSDHRALMQQIKDKKPKSKEEAVRLRSELLHW